MVRDESGQHRQDEILEAMQLIAETLSGRSSFEDKCNTVVRILVNLVPADLVTLRRPDETGDNMVLVGYAAQPGFVYEPPAVVTNQRLISYQYFQNEEVHFSNDYASRPDAYQHFLDIGVRSCAFLPIDSQGAFFGLIYIISKEAGLFTPERVRLLSTIKHSLGVLFENADLYEKISEELDLIHKAQAALSESEARFRTLAENTADLLWEINLQSVYTYCSPNARSITGYGPEEMVGSSQYDFMPPDERDGVGATFLELASAGNEILLMEYNFISRDGRTIVMERNGAPILDENGDLTGYRGIDRDITNRKRAEENLREADRLASIGALAAGVAHELNNPLTSVMLYSEHVLNQDLADDVRKSVLTVNQEARRMGRIVKSLLDFARGSEPEIVETSIVSTIRKALALKSHDFQVNNVNLNDDLLPQEDGDFPGVMADDNQMLQVMLNLLNNAEQACTAARTDGSITNAIVKIGASQSGGDVIVFVEDNGPGISKETLPKIFDPFFTTRDIGQGTGLGLSVSQGIVALHGGEIWAENLPAGGSGFYVKLPAIIR